MSAADHHRKERILEAAEQCFASAGFAAASLRMIVEDGRVNLATVYYYFGSKEGLVVAVLQRRLGPLRDQSLVLLDRAVRDAAPEAPAVEEILDAMLRPVVELAQTASQESVISLGLIGRMWTEPSEPIQQLLLKEFAELRARFFQAFEAACPHLRKADLLWRIEAARAAVSAMLCNMRRIKEATGGVCDPSDARAVLSHLVPLFAAGFRAPAAVRKAAAGRKKAQSLDLSLP